MLQDVGNDTKIMGIIGWKIMVKQKYNRRNSKEAKSYFRLSIEEEGQANKESMI